MRMRLAPVRLAVCRRCRCDLGLLANFSRLERRQHRTRPHAGSERARLTCPPPQRVDPIIERTTRERCSWRVIWVTMGRWGGLCVGNGGGPHRFSKKGCLAGGARGGLKSTGKNHRVGRTLSGFGAAQLKSNWKPILIFKKECAHGKSGGRLPLKSFTEKRIRQSKRRRPEVE